MQSAQYDFFADWERSWDATSSICSTSHMPSVELPSTLEEEETFSPVEEEYEVPQPVLRTAWVLENNAREAAQETTPTTTTTGRRSRFVQRFDAPPMEFPSSSYSSSTSTTTPSTISIDSTWPPSRTWSSTSSTVDADEQSAITLLDFDEDDVSLWDTALLGELHLRTVDSRELQRGVVRKDQTDKRIRKVVRGFWEMWRHIIKKRIGERGGARRKVGFCWKEEVVV